jgi:hypothetical protein
MMNDIYVTRSKIDSDPKTYTSSLPPLLTLSSLPPLLRMDMAQWMDMARRVV